MDEAFAIRPAFGLGPAPVVFNCDRLLAVAIGLAGMTASPLGAGFAATSPFSEPDRAFAARSIRETPTWAVMTGNRDEFLEMLATLTTKGDDTFLLFTTLTGARADAILMDARERDAVEPRATLADDRNAVRATAFGASAATFAFLGATLAMRTCTGGAGSSSCTSMISPPPKA